MITIPIANGIVFKAVDSLAQSLDNTLDRNNIRNNRTINCYKTKVGGEVRLMVVSDADPEPDYMVWAYKDESTSPNAFTIDTASSFQNGGLWYWVLSYQPYWPVEYYKLVQNTGNNGEIAGGTVVMVSEPVQGITATDELLLEWYNHEPAFGLNYGTVNDMPHFLPSIYIDAEFEYLDTPTEDSIYKNQGVETLLKSTLADVYRFSCDVPDYMCRLLKRIMKHDRLFINDREYIANKATQATRRGKSNLYNYSIELTDKLSAVTNGHDTGFDLNSIVNNEVMVVKKLAQTGNFTVPVAAGFTFHMVTEVWKAGTGISIDMGTTASGTDLVNGDEVSVSITKLYPTPHYPFVSAGTIYVTLTGSTPSVDFYFQFVKNT